MSITLCVAPRNGETCVPLQILLRRDCTAMELTSRHRINGVVWDEEEQSIALLVEITDPTTARPVDVRIDVVRAGHQMSSGRTRFIGEVERDGESLCVYGTYLGVVADEN